VSISGDKSQHERTKALSLFKNGSCPLMVCWFILLLLLIISVCCCGSKKICMNWFIVASHQLLIVFSTFLWPCWMIVIFFSLFLSPSFCSIFSLLVILRWCFYPDLSVISFCLLKFKVLQH
jgi:hypothetical protein